MNQSYPCPCCNYLTLTEESPGSFEICPVCHWEDDNVQYDDPEYSGGANTVSLSEARVNYKKYGAVSEEFVSDVRSPTDDEIIGS